MKRYFGLSIAPRRLFLLLDWMLPFLILLLLMIIPPTNSVIQCTSDEECTIQLREGSKCSNNGICQNPFHEGCLRRYLGPEKFPQKRICNSHDGDPTTAHRLGHCDLPVLLNYTELRILSQDWDSAMLTTWIMQIFLSEIIQVPVSIETSSYERNNNFYDLDNSFDYSTSYDYDAIRRVVTDPTNVHGTCTDIIQRNNDYYKNKNNKNNINTTYEYQSCAHIMPEVWNGQYPNLRKLEEEQIIELSESAGGVAKYSWYVPKFVAETNHSFLSHFGLRDNTDSSVVDGTTITTTTTNNEARQRLADTFFRPTTWSEYCTLVSSTNCTSPDTTAIRSPQSIQEGELYFLDGFYQGYFRRTKDNDCDTYPDTCTGHITNVVCSWSTFVIPQAHYANIAVSSNGPTINGGYPFLRMLEIWKAANATRSPVLFYWFEPDPMLQEFVGTQSEFQRVLLPFPTQECVENRVSQEQRCSSNPNDHIGLPDGSCDSDAHSYQKIIAGNLYDITQSVPIALQSPSYDAIKRFKISDLQMNQIFRYWYGRNIDRWNYDPREAVCRWCAENLDELQRFIPRTYPRTIQESDDINHGYLVPFLYGAITLGSIACLSIVGTAITVYHLRLRPAIYTAQVEFILILLTGLLLVAMASVLSALEPTRFTCLFLSWLVVLGYTLELTPLIVKVAAINKLMSASRRMQRIQLNRTTLFYYVFLIFCLAVSFLICWTVLDPQTRRDQYLLTDTINEHGGNVIEVSYFCGSNNDAWRYTALTWQALLLLCGTVLAIQSRNARSEFNESQSLAFMVYSHFVFLILRIISILLEGQVPANLLAGFQSYIYSVDTIATISIYFLPKFGRALSSRQSDNQRRGARVFVTASNSLNRFLAKISRASLEGEVEDTPTSRPRVPADWASSKRVVLQEQMEEAGTTTAVSLSNKDQTSNDIPDVPIASDVAKDIDLTELRNGPKEEKEVHQEEMEEVVTTTGVSLCNEDQTSNYISDVPMALDVAKDTDLTERKKGQKEEEEPRFFQSTDLFFGRRMGEGASPAHTHDTTSSPTN